MVIQKTSKKKVRKPRQADMELKVKSGNTLAVLRGKWWIGVLDKYNYGYCPLVPEEKDGQLTGNLVQGRMRFCNTVESVIESVSRAAAKDKARAGEITEIRGLIDEIKACIAELRAEIQA